MQGRRVEWPEGLLNAGEYARHPETGEWHAMTPTGLLANLSKHDVTEHDDGTITAWPSILVTRRDESWHGYLERGVWRGQ